MTVTRLSDLVGIAVATMIALSFMSWYGLDRSPSDARLDSTRQLLKDYYREINASVLADEENSALRKLGREKPIEELLTLYMQKDDSVLTLGGVFWAGICTAVGPGSFTKELTKGLEDEDPRWRAFACEALGAMKEHAAAIPIRRLLDDHEVVPGYWGSPSVAVFAASSLASLGHDDGALILIDYIDRSHYWPPKYVSQLKELSGKDFGRNTRAWRLWFQSERRDAASNDDADNP